MSKIGPTLYIPHPRAYDNAHDENFTPRGFHVQRGKTIVQEYLLPGLLSPITTTVTATQHTEDKQPWRLRKSPTDPAYHFEHGLTAFLLVPPQQFRRLNSNNVFAKYVRGIAEGESSPRPDAINHADGEIFPAARGAGLGPSLLLVG